jgi:tetratricopeptide (TPR) repeat protein
VSQTSDLGWLEHERYVIGRKLGEGGMGVVYHAQDRTAGREVALKVMKSSLAGTARRRFEREFRSLASLKHPHCLQVHEFGELDSGPFFTMDLFEGKPITSLAGGPLEEILPPLLEVTLALDYIHDHGIVHRDIKPSNIIVRPAARANGERRFEAKLMDFGLAKYYGVKSSLSAEAGFVGTVAYCAPEQLNNDELDHRADLYCLGLVAYELLSGRYPFPEARLGGMRALMRAQISETPRPLADVCPDLPKPIADALARYLRKPARKRPDSAALLRDAIAAHLKLSDPSVTLHSAVRSIRSVITVTGFVCRSRELESIELAVRRCLAALSSDPLEFPPALIVAMGEPGIGKSSLVREGERAARGHGCQVYQGRCLDGNLSAFQPFVEMIRQLIVDLRMQMRRAAEGVPEEELTGSQSVGVGLEQWAGLSAIVNDYAGEILRIAPDLRKYLPGEAFRQIDFAREADYIFRALSAFFIEVATLQPICLSFEDIQWADKSSLDLLRQLCISLDESRRSSSGSAAPRLTIIASARAGYPHLDALLTPLRDRRATIEFALAPLSEEETRELLALRLNCRPEDLSEELVGRVHQLCGGNPFFVSETIREWFEKNAITRDGSVWSLATLQADQSDLPQSVREAMRLRVQGLAPKTQQVLGAASVIGALVEIELLREALPDLSESDILDALDDLIPRRVLRETADVGRVEFVHDLLREFPYADLSPIRRRSLHRRVGELLEARLQKGQPIPAAVLAAHFRDADQAEKAFAYDLDAAAAALEAYAFRNAITHLEDALALMPEATTAARRNQLYDMLGSAYASAGRLDDAAFAHEKALEFAADDIQKAAAYRGIGIAQERKGDFDDAIRSFCSALEEIGQPFPKSFVGQMIDMNRSAFFFHVVPAGLQTGARRADRTARTDVAFATHYNLAWLLVSKGLIEYTLACYRLAVVAKRSGKPEHRCVAYTKFGINFGLFSLAGVAQFYGRLAKKAAALCDRDEDRSRTNADVGMVLYYAGKLDAAEQELTSSLAILDKVRDRTALFAHHHLRHIHGVRGDTARELAEADYEIGVGTASGNWEPLAWGHYGKANALARAGKLEQAQELAASAVTLTRANGSWVLTVASAVQGFVRLQASDYEGARIAFEESRRLVNRTFFFVELVAQTYPGLVESLLGPCWCSADRGPGRSIARKAWRESRMARLIGWRFPNQGPYTLRVSGRAAFAVGKRRRAEAYFDRAIMAAEKLGARYDLARALLDASIVNAEKSNIYRERGEKLLEELGAVVPEAERCLIGADQAR